MSQTQSCDGASSPSRKRVAILATALLLAAVDLAVKATAVTSLSKPVDLAILELRIGYNPGVAFSLGDTLPSIVVVVATVAITLAMATYVVVAAPTLDRWSLAGFVLATGGAIGNVVDRIEDGVVTDYLHTGWFPTFNLADILITIGAAALLWGAVREPRPEPSKTSTKSAAAS